VASTGLERLSVLAIQSVMGRGRRPIPQEVQALIRRITGLVAAGVWYEGSREQLRPSREEAANLLLSSKHPVYA
jgi:hypothetical protein